MRIPSFVPLVESERRKREISGLVVESLMWGYALVILTRIVVGAVFLRFIEDIKFNETPWWLPIKEFPAGLVNSATAFLDKIAYDSRNFSLEWTTLGWLFLAGAVLGLIIGRTGRGFGTWIASISKLQVSNPDDSVRIHKHWSYARKEAWFFFILTIIAAWNITKIDLGKLFESNGVVGATRLSLQLACGIPGVGATLPGGHTVFEGVQWLANGFIGFANMLGGLLGSLHTDPNWWTEIPRFDMTCEPTNLPYYGMLLGKLAESIYLAFIATFLSVPIAFVLSFFAARNLTRHSRLTRSIYVIVRMYMNVTRSIEALIWAILFSVWIGIGPFAGSIALMVHSVSSLVKQYSESVESVDEGPIEALQATGANRIATVWYAVVPQVVLPYLAFTIYRWDINVRMATIIGLVGGGGIGSVLIQEQGQANWTAVGSIAFLIFIVVWGMDFLSARVREAIQ